MGSEGEMMDRVFTEWTQVPFWEDGLIRLIFGGSSLFEMFIRFVHNGVYHAEGGFSSTDERISTLLKAIV